MSNIWFGSDFHFGHKNIAKFRDGFTSEEDHREWVIKECNKVLTKRDNLYLLGDIVFYPEYLDQINRLNCPQKFLIRGNHDTCSTAEYLTVFKEVYGLLRYKQLWLSHAPIHQDELRGKINLHGHVHYATLNDARYLNCCVENLRLLYGRPIISLAEVRQLRNLNKPHHEDQPSQDL